jgi:hypothetical protein
MRAVPISSGQGFDSGLKNAAFPRQAVVAGAPVVVLAVAEHAAVVGIWLVLISAWANGPRSSERAFANCHAASGQSHRCGSGAQRRYLLNQSSVCCQALHHR